MPAVPDMPGILLELARIADETGIEFQSISPEASTVEGDYQVVPIGLIFDGNFYELSDLLFRLRTLVGVRHGELEATGRLFSVEKIDFAESPERLPGHHRQPDPERIRLRHRDGRERAPGADRDGAAGGRRGVGAAEAEAPAAEETP